MLDCAVASRDGFGAGVVLTVLWGLPVLFLLLYVALRGISPASRAERGYRREVNSRAAACMHLGVPPSDARDRARADMEREALEVLNA